MSDEKYRHLDDALRAALTLPDAASLQVTAAPLVLTGDTRLADVRFLSRGGMGSVYRARDLSLDCDVAIKLVRPGRWDAELAQRLQREAHTLARLRHPGIVSLLRTDEREGHLLIVMELVQGEPLRRFVRKLHPIETVRLVMMRCGEALCAAHQAGFAHRDFKPDNVIVRAGFSPCVLDFGLARAIGARSPDFPTLTRPGQVMGTATYMAPEQCRGERGDALSDQYSFGLTSWQALHGALPDAPAESQRKVPAELDAVLLRMMAARAADRYPTLAEGLAALGAVTPSESDPR